MTDKIKDKEVLEIPDFLRNQSEESTAVEKTKEKESLKLDKNFPEAYEELRKIDMGSLKRDVQIEAYMYVKENKAVGKNKLLWHLTDDLKTRFKERLKKHHNFELTQKFISRCISRLKHNRVFATKSYNGHNGKLVLGDYTMNRFSITKIKVRI